MIDIRCVTCSYREQVKDLKQPYQATYGYYGKPA